MKKSLHLSKHAIRTFLLMAFFAILFSASLKTTAQVARPSYNTGTGFFVLNGKLYDANGQSFIPMGFNGAEFYNDSACSLAKFSGSLPRSNANMVRINAVIPTKNTWSWMRHAANQRKTVQLCVENKIVPVLEFHDVTCGHEYTNDPEGKNLKDVVDYWITPAMVQLAKDYEKYLIINIANEWGENNDTWFNSYKTAITALRNAGIKNTIMIDAGGYCGQNPNSIVTWGQQLLDHDPQKNIMLSIHMYAFWVTNDMPVENWQYKVESFLQQFKNANLPIIVGEFGWTGTSDVRYNPQTLISLCDMHGFGWLFWSWFDTPDHTYYNTIKNLCTGYNTAADLSTAGAYLVPYLQQHAMKASVFNSGSSNTTINFNALAAGLLSNPYNDGSGYTFTGAYSPNNSPDPLRITDRSGNKVLINNNWSSRITLTKTGSGAFNLVSFKYAGDPWGGTCDAVVTGTYASGGTVTANYTGTSTTFQTLTLNWSNLSKVVIEFNGGANNDYGMVDDFTVSSISGQRSITTVSSDETPKQEMFKVYPNPSSGLLNIDLPVNLRKGTLKIYDITGRLQMTKNISSSLQQLQVNGLLRGEYIIKATGADNKTYSARFTLMKD